MNNHWLYSLIFIYLTFSSYDARASTGQHSARVQSTQEERMTGLFGRPIGRKTSLLTAGYHGPALLQDVQFLEEMAHFDRERIPERVVHAKGSGAFGHFRVTSTEIKKYTKLKVFDSVGKQTEVAARFSTVAGEKGSADTVFGDPRGFAVKFYSEDGNWDLVGNSVPMFFIRDAMQFPSLIHANKRNPQTGMKDPNMLWDFNSLRPETLNLNTYMFSDYGIPDGYRHMPGFSIHAYKLVNSEGKHVYAKFHWVTNQGIKNLETKEAERVRGVDPEHDRRDLFDNIARGNYPSWVLKAQVITEEQAKRFPFNPFDATKIWPEDKYPLFEIGVMTLDRNAQNFFAEIEQLAFCPANLVPGIEPSPDLLLVGRLFSYQDTQRHRLGANFHLIPVNMPKNKAMALTQRDGPMRTDGNMGGHTNYYPNSFSATRDSDNNLESNFTLNDAMVYRYDDSDDHNYEQPRDLYRSFSDDWKDRLHKNVALAMNGADARIRERALAEFQKVDPAYAEGIRTELNKLMKKSRTSKSTKGVSSRRSKSRRNSRRSPSSYGRKRNVEQ